MTTPAQAESSGRTRVLIIDDDRKLCRLIRDYLEPMGHDIAMAHTGPEGLELALRDKPNAIILDVMLPGMDGFEVLKKLRATSDVPVLMLTGRGEEPDRIVGLEIGADDYLPKTFSTRELLARLRAVTRRAGKRPRAGAPGREAPISLGRLTIDPIPRTAQFGGQPMTLTPVEYNLLTCLARAAGRVKSRELLIEE